MNTTLTALLIKTLSNSEEVVDSSVYEFVIPSNLIITNQNRSSLSFSQIRYIKFLTFKNMFSYTKSNGVRPQVSLKINYIILLKIQI